MATGDLRARLRKAERQAADAEARRGLEDETEQARYIERICAEMTPAEIDDLLAAFDRAGLSDTSALSPQEVAARLDGVDGKDVEAIMNAAIARVDFEWSDVFPE